MEHTECMNDAMSELMKRQKSLMLKNHDIGCRELLQLSVIHQSYSPQGCQSNPFFSTSNYLCLEG